MTLPGHSRTVTGIAVAPDSSWLASVGGGTVRISDAVSGEERLTLQGDAAESLTSVAIAPDGSWLATGGLDKTVRIYDASTGSLRMML